jgi:cysteine desulfurase family protein
MAQRRIYLDNAATSFPKPAAVYDAVDHYNRQIGVAMGRGAYRQAAEVQAVVGRCRRRAAELFRAESVERMVFTFNATDALCLAIHGLLEPGDHVVTSALEHNSVMRPLREAERRGVSVTAVGAHADGRIDPGEVRKSMRPETRLVALIHASNVTGAIQPLDEIGAIAKSGGALFLVDAAQTAGHLPIDVQALGADLLACAGHKGLLGPLGTGLLYVRTGVEQKLKSLRQGGTGSNSEDDRQPDILPDKYEPGNHNVPGIYGLDAGLAFLDEKGIETLRRHEQELTRRMLDGLTGIPAIQVAGPPNAEARVGVVSVWSEGFEPQELASILDTDFGIQTRAGLHCAPGVHRLLGTLERGGTVRFSFGPFNTADDVDAAVAALRGILG